MAVVSARVGRQMYGRAKQSGLAACALSLASGAFGCQVVKTCELAEVGAASGLETFVQAPSDLVEASRPLPPSFTFCLFCQSVLLPTSTTTNTLFYSRMASAPTTPGGGLDRYLVIHVATTCDEHGVYVTKDSAEVIELGWILLDSKNCDEVGRNAALICNLV